jgi:hypothetical protein
MAANLAYKDRSWAVQPKAESIFRALLTEALAACPPAADYADALLERAGVRLRDIIDHVEFSDDALAARIAEAGWQEGEQGIWSNRSGLFPTFVRRPEGGLNFLLRVESAEQFVGANGLNTPIVGKAHGPARSAKVFEQSGVSFSIFERNGYAGYGVPDAEDSLIRSARVHLQTFRSRRRQFDRAEEGLAHTEGLVDSAVADLGPHWACDLWLRAEREFWMLRCAAGRLQKARQDALGIGWSNIDHHTYDGSRRYFRHTIRILEKLGYELREMIYAGELAGWGSQVLEQPVIGSTIFADVDLAPEELDIDFAHEELPELPKMCRAGVVSALHGESILEAGLNHVAFLYDQEALRAQLAREGVKMMSPFSSFPHLYQELTLGDWVAVDPKRVDALEAAGHIGRDEAEKIRLEGAILTHLENIERNDAFKGFNKPGIDGVLRKIDPRAYDVMKQAATVAE